MNKLVNFSRDRKRRKWDEFRQDLFEIIPSIYFYEEIQGYPEAKFELGSMKVCMFCSENFLRRRKFFRSYNTFIKISCKNNEVKTAVKDYLEKVFDRKCLKSDEDIIININKEKNREKFLQFLRVHVES